jgi:hypothetical protein
MAKERSPNFIYVLSDVLKQEVAISKKTGWLYCADGVKYSPQELCVMESAGAQIDILTHMVKKVIGGEVVKIDRTTSSTGERKPVERTTSNDKPNNSDEGKQIQSPSGVGAESRDGELDIF